MATTIGNYDYLFDWVFNDAAEIEARVGATGIDALKGVTTRRMTDATAADDTRYGTLVAPNLVAVNHDHYFNFRLDLDVDEGGNSFNHDVYKPVMLPADSPRRSIYVVERQMADTEKAGQLDEAMGRRGYASSTRAAPIASETRCRTRCSSPITRGCCWIRRIGRRGGQGSSSMTSG